MMTSRKRLEELAHYVRDDPGFRKIIEETGITSNDDVKAAIHRVWKNLGGGVVTHAQSPRSVAIVHELVIEM